MSELFWKFPGISKEACHFHFHVISWISENGWYYPARAPSQLSFSKEPTKILDVSVLFQHLPFNYLWSSIILIGCLNKITFSMTKYLLESPSLRCSICDLLISFCCTYCVLFLNSIPILYLLLINMVFACLSFLCLSQIFSYLARLRTTLLSNETQQQIQIGLMFMLFNFISSKS